jgi:hypothetical protein
MVSYEHGIANFILGNISFPMIILKSWHLFKELKLLLLFMLFFVLEQFQNPN